MESILKQLKDKYSENDYKQLRHAFSYATKAHRGQTRLSGEPYILHSYEVARVLFELGLDPTTIIAGLLHDVVEDTSVTTNDIAREFGEEVANLVDGVTKLGIIEYKSREERQAESMRKMFLAMANDIRVVLIKFADRLHNMRTLKYQSQDKQKEKALETLEIFAPLAHRLGITSLQWELEDLSLKYLDKDGYFDIVSKLALTREQRENTIQGVIDALIDKLKEVNIHAEILGRPKHIYSIYEKMKARKKSFEEIYDLIAVRILVDTVKDCYNALGVVHTLWRPIPNLFKDYIAVPKQNMYQSLHSTLLGDDGKPFEVQIRTFEMHRTAEYGIAAHWAYKEGTEADLDEKLTWLREILEWQTDLKDSKEFMESLKLDFYKDEVFVFTPKGDVKSFPSGATPIDFAYSIHSQIGEKCVGAKVNGKIVPLDYKLQTGDITEIITSTTLKGPSRDWLKSVQTGQAKTQIRAWFKRQAKEENISKGKENLEREVKRAGFEWQQLFRSDYLAKVFKRFSINTLEDLYASVGYGGVTAMQIINRLVDLYKKDNPEIADLIQTEPLPKRRKYSNMGVKVAGHDNMLIRFAKCCNPVAGDEIVGYVTRGRGVSIHRKDCTNINDTDFLEGRMLEVSWAENTGRFNVEVGMEAQDRKGLLLELTSLIASMDLSITQINAQINRMDQATIKIAFEIGSTEELQAAIKKLRMLPGVYDVYRLSKR